MCNSCYLNQLHRRSASCCCCCWWWSGWWWYDDDGDMMVIWWWWWYDDDGDMMMIGGVDGLDYYVDSNPKEISVSMFVCVDCWTGWLVTLTCLKLNCLRRGTAKDQDPGGWGWGGTTCTVTSRMTLTIRWAAMRAIFNVSLIVRDKVTKTLSKSNTFLKRMESRSGIEPKPFCFPV